MAALSGRVDSVPASPSQDHGSVAGHLLLKQAVSYEGQYALCRHFGSRSKPRGEQKLSACRPPWRRLSRHVRPHITRVLVLGSGTRCRREAGRMGRLDKWVIQDITHTLCVACLRKKRSTRGTNVPHIVIVVVDRTIAFSSAFGTKKKKKQRGFQVYSLTFHRFLSLLLG